MEAKYKIRDRFYTANSCRIGRWTVEEVIKIENKEGSRIEYVIADGIGRTKKIAENTVPTFNTLAEAKIKALQDLQALEKQLRQELETMTDKSIDAEVKKQLKHIAEKDKKRK